MLDGVCVHTHSILEAEQHDLQLTDGGALKVQLQLELRQRAGDDFPVCHANKVGQTDHEGGDVLRLQLHRLRALQVRETDAMTGKAEVHTEHEGSSIWRMHWFMCLTGGVIHDWPVWGPPSGWPPPCPGPRSGCGAGWLVSRCPSAAWRSLNPSHQGTEARCGPQSSPLECWVKKKTYVFGSIMQK